MGFFSDIKKAVSKVYYDAKKVVYSVGKEAKSAGKGIGKFAQGVGDNINNTLHNASNLMSPQNLLLYAGVFIGAMVLLPKILETPAAQRVAEKI